MPLPQVLVIAVHARPQRCYRISVFNLHVNQGNPIVLLTASLTRHPLTGGDLGYEIQEAAFSLRRFRKHFLVQPLDLSEFEAFGPGRKEQEEKLRKEFAQ